MTVIFNSLWTRWGICCVTWFTWCSRSMNAFFKYSVLLYTLSVLKELLYTLSVLKECTLWNWMKCYMLGTLGTMLFKVFFFLWDWRRSLDWCVSSIEKRQCLLSVVLKYNLIKSDKNFNPRPVIKHEFLWL
jgi:hypothetical protein